MILMEGGGPKDLTKVAVVEEDAMEIGVLVGFFIGVFSLGFGCRQRRLGERQRWRALVCRVIGGGSVNGGWWRLGEAAAVLCLWHVGGGDSTSKRRRRLARSWRGSALIPYRT